MLNNRGPRLDFFETLATTPVHAEKVSLSFTSQYRDDK